MTARAMIVVALAMTAACLELPADASNPGRSHRRPGARSAVPYVLGPTLELYDSRDRTAAAAGYRNYRHQPVMVIAPSGDLVALHRAAISHSGADDALAVIRSHNGGRSWSDRRTEVTFSNDAAWQEIGSLGRVGDRLWIAGSDVDVIAPITAPSRTCFTAYSDDDGVTWTAKSYNVPTPGTNFTTCTANTGIYEANNGDLLMPAYGSDVSSTRYTAWMFRSTDNGATWVVGSTIADTPGGSRQYEEPGCIHTGATHICLLRVDNEPSPGTDPNIGRIYVTRSTDDAATWSSPVYVYDGRGTPAVVRIANGTIVASNRSRGVVVGTDTTGFRGELYYSRDDGVTWARGGEFQDPLDGPDDLYGGPYMGASLVEVRPNVIGALSAHETTTIANQYSGLYYREVAFDGAAVAVDDRDSAASLWFPTTPGPYVDYGTGGNLTNGATAATFSFWLEKLYSPGVPWTSGDEAMLTRRLGSTQYHLDIRLRNTRQIQVLIGATLTTNAVWTSPTNVAELDNGQRTRVTVRFDGAGATNADRLRVWLDGREVTADGTFSGSAVPAQLTSPTTSTWQIGASGGTSITRSVYIDDVLIWAAAINPANVADLWNDGLPGREEWTGLGTPAVWLRFDNSLANSGTASGWSPTVGGTGTLSYATRSYAARPSYRAWTNVSGTARAPAGTAWLTRAVTANSDLDPQAFTVCTWIRGSNVAYEGPGFRSNAVTDEVWWLGGYPVGGGALRWVAGIGQPLHGIQTPVEYFDTTAPHSLCFVYAPDTPIGYARLYIDGVDRTVFESPGVPEPVITGNYVPTVVSDGDGSNLDLNVGSTGPGMDSFTLYRGALSDAEVLEWHCATQTSPGAECASVVADFGTVIFHPDFVDLYRFDIPSDYGLSFTGLHNLAGTANMVAAPAAP